MSNSKQDCAARQHSDQLICGRCGLVWDINDPEPPECNLKVNIDREYGTRQMAKIRKKVRPCIS